MAGSVDALQAWEIFELKAGILHITRLHAYVVEIVLLVDC
jgi:hypothetical protein